MKTFFFFEEHLRLCPWSLASSIPVLGLESVCPGKGCPWPRIFFVSLASSLVSSTPPLVSITVSLSIVLYRKLFLYAVILMLSSVNTIVNRHNLQFLSKLRHITNRSLSRKDVLVDFKNSLLVVDNIFV